MNLIIAMIIFGVAFITTFGVGIWLVCIIQNYLNRREYEKLMKNKKIKCL